MTTTLSFDQEKLLSLSELLVDKCDKLFDKLEVPLAAVGSSMYVGCCPIHGGDNKTAFNLYADGHTTKGNWVCRTHHCNKIFKPTIIGFVRGVLSAKNGWSENRDDKKYPWMKTIMWCCEFLGVAWKDIKITQSYTESKKFITSQNVIQRKRLNSTGVSRDKVLKNLKIPDGYFARKGYDQELLNRYDVGLCLKSNQGFLGRVIVPVYEDTGKFMTAFSGRTINPLCEKCDSYHKPLSPCPNSSIRHLYCKWKHSPNINNYLYNYWVAKRHIKEKGEAILVEGPGDVWKLEQYGIKNSVAIFGVDISTEQEIILETSGCLKVKLLLDMDKAGRDGCIKINDKLKNIYNLSIPEYSCHDPAELTKEEALKVC